MAHQTSLTEPTVLAGRGQVTPGQNPPRRSLATSRSRLGRVVVAPALLLLTVFFFLPVALMLWMSLHKWPLLGKISFIGPGNYIAAF